MTSRDAAAPHTAPSGRDGDIQHEKGGFTMRPRTFLLFALAALAGATVVVLPALAVAGSEAKLEVNENCVENDWPCWAAPGSGPKPEPASKLTIAAGGEVKFTDNANTAAAVVWTGSVPACTGVPATAMTKWEGTCKFEHPGTYKFESPTLFNGGPSENYTKYEIVVEGTHAPGPSKHLGGCQAGVAAAQMAQACARIRSKERR